MSSSASPVSVGFAAVNLMEILKQQRPTENPVEVRAVFFRQDGRNSVFLVSDFMDFNLLVVDTLKKAVAKVLPPETGIHIITTHNHGGLTFKFFDLERYGELAARCALAAMNACRPAMVRSGRGEITRPLTMVRRIYVPEVEGKLSCFFGIREDENRNGAPYIEAALREIREGKALSYKTRCETNRPYQPFDPADPELDALEFIAADDPKTILGRIVRFACHANCCNRSDYISADYPGYLRQMLDARRPGLTVFFNGPCGEITPAIPDKSPESGKNLAGALAELAEKVLRDAECRPLAKFEDHACAVDLPVRPEVLANHVEIPAEIPGPLPDRKRYLEILRLNGTLDFLREKYTFGETELKETVRISCALLKLDRLGFLFMPGETFNATGQRIREAVSEPDLITVTEHDRTVMYLPPEEEFRQGGYEMTCSVTACGAEAVMREKLIGFIRNLNDPAGKKAI